MKTLFLLVVLLACSGCFTRTVYVPAGKSVMLRKELKSIPVWAKDASGKMVPGTLTLREGWFVLPCEEPEAPVLTPAEIQ
jgi:hypothetical protein